jgi:UDP-glucose 4-epimerase
MKTVLVTGAAGFIGSHTVEKLLSEGCRVIGVDNFRTGCRKNLNSALKNTSFRLIEDDVSDDSILERIVAETKPHAIIHLAALVSVPESIANPELNYRLNLHATQLVAEAARRHRIPRVVFASSAAVYGNRTDLPLSEAAYTFPISPYGGAKLASESLLLGHAAAFGFTARCQRFFNVYGLRQDPSSPYSGVISLFLKNARAGKPVTVFGDGLNTRDFISVSDVARANALAALGSDLSSGVANICTGQQLSLRRILKIFSHHFPDAPAPIFAAPRPGDIVHSCGNSQRARDELGFTAKIPIETGLAELIRSA